ncbi:MAG: mandelate racemase [Betaproteobacteria bacterium]|nr:mandelate racemase [Betaproteobacteria bacterium]
MRTLEQITIYRLRVPLAQPYRLAFGAVEHYDTMVVEIMNRDGACGLGEATILTGYTNETIEESWRAARQLAPELPNDDEREARGKLTEFAENYPFTATAFGTALEMLNGSRLLSVSHKTRVPLVGLLNAAEEDAMRAEFEQLLAAGYGTIKVKVGFDATQDARVISSVQKLANGRARIRIDANQGYSAEQGMAFVRALDPRDIELFEQPCAAGDWESHLAVAKVSPVPLMLDESIYGIADIEKAAALNTAAYIKVKLMKFVTLEALVEAIQRIRALGMRPVLGNGVACDLGCWMEGCIAAEYIDNAGEMNGFLKARAPLFSRRLEVHDGALWLEPGFPPRLDVANVKRYLVDTVTCMPRTATRAAS